MKWTLLLALAGCRVYVDLPAKDGDPDTAGPDTAGETGDSAVDTAPDDTDTDPDTGAYADPELPEIVAGDLADGEAPALDDTACAGGAAAWLVSTGTAHGTVQAAIDAASDGETVVVCAGTWTESLMLPAHTLTLQGYGAGVTVLDGGGVARVLEVPEGAVFTLADVTVQNGSAPVHEGGGLLVDDATVTVTRVTFTGNLAEEGGAVYQLDGHLTIEDCVVDANTAYGSGGGVRYDGDDPLTITSSTFSGNYAEDGGGRENNGGGLTVTAADRVTIEDSTFIDNLSRNGGAIAYDGADTGTGMEVTRCSFTGNAATHEGGALWVAELGIHLLDSVVSGNHADYAGGAAKVGGWGRASLTAEGSRFTANRSERGGAFYVGDRGESHLNLASSWVDANSATSHGGAFSIIGGGSVQVTSGGVVLNTADGDIGGAYLDDEGELRVEDANWGAGAWDNVPEDLRNGFRYGAHATFACEAGACAP